ncbi:SMP-30/gluconolactonase/LRE family protein [Sphingomonas crocodyli]|uniref:SMP-30/gluconolactonase/LRE family protein n=1 Tax=Sphingomonas crocodyli TaxID=1979270 RepID=A0A437LVN8_9SPHN|nr:SMP-30/gluconolactonase/LRE family protein [Sphingomonas crocodyli]RVT89447.1 SMP-30/gluconolactonase/LRE family protein [Sphingomonas crocodyli]
MIELTATKVVTTGLMFPEGPIALDDGTVLVTEIEGNSLARVSPDGSIRRYPCDPGPNGQAVGPDGAVYVCTDGGLAFMTQDGIRFPHALRDGWTGGNIQRLDLASGAIETIFTQVDGQPILSLNDAVFDTSGGAYVVDTAKGCLYYMDPIARTIRVAETGLEAPNGFGLSPDGKRAYGSETYSGRLWVWDVTGAGELANRALHYQADGHGWDGLAVDGAGNVCGSNLVKSGISVISPTGELIGLIKTEEYDSFVTNICFADDGTAFICSSGRGKLYAIAWPWPPLQLNYTA